MSELLIENMPFVFRVEESKSGSGKIVARGQFARSDKPTANKRLYREHLWKREINRLNEAIQRRRCFGELDHPQDGRTKLQRVSHLVTNLKVDGNDVVGEAELLDTPNGRILQALAKANAEIGISSRGYGSVKTLPDGTQEVQEDFRLDTFDFVADPATHTAYPGIFTEEKQHIEEVEESMSLDALRRYYPGILEEFRREVLEESGESAGDPRSMSRAITEAEERTERRLREDFSIELRRHLETVGDQIREEVRSELLSDPDVAGAKQIVERIYGMVRSFGPPEGEEASENRKKVEDLEQKLGDKELENQKLQREAQEAQKLARQAAYALHLERSVSDHPARKAVIELIGDTSKFESKEELDRKIEAVCNELDDRGVRDDDAVDSERLQQAEEETASLRDRVDRLEEENKDLRSQYREMENKARRALDVAEERTIQLHLEQRLNEDHPYASRLRDLCEGVINEDQIDRIVDGFTPPTGGRRLDEDEANRIRARVSKGKERDLVEDTHGSSNGRPFSGNAVPQGNGHQQGQNLLEGFGLSGDEYDKLAGTKSS